MAARVQVIQACFGRRKLNVAAFADELEVDQAPDLALASDDGLHEVVLDVSLLRKPGLARQAQVASLVLVNFPGVAQKVVSGRAVAADLTREARRVVRSPVAELQVIVERGHVVALEVLAAATLQLAQVWVA